MDARSQNAAHRQQYQYTMRCGYSSPRRQAQSTVPPRHNVFRAAFVPSLHCLTQPPPVWFFLDKIFAGRKVKIVKRTKYTRPARESGGDSEAVEMNAFVCFQYQLFIL
jgi:hypothetical protein